MSHVKLLDCTLRDGAYLVDKNFGNQTIQGIIEGLVKAKIDYIEIGFLQDEGFGEGKTVFCNAEDARRFLPQNKNGCDFALLADFSRYSISNLDDYMSGGIDAIRECFFKEERFEAVNVCRVIKEKGYKLFVQPVDILGYSDKELIDFIEKINEIEPYCFSIVDTFGSMYQEDLHHVFEIINRNLVTSCKIGFHSHNNMQLSNALSQEFIRISAGKRKVIIDGTISGMGRGAGNTPIELIAEYLVAKKGAGYEIDILLDIIDTYIDNIRSYCKWGYSTEYFIAGCYGAHVNNINYLIQKNSIRSKDIRYIFNKIGPIARKKYDYELLEKTYVELLDSKIDDSEARNKIKSVIGNRPVLILVPGTTVNTYIETISQYIEAHNPFIISVNFIHKSIISDFIYMSNIKRFQVWHDTEEFKNANKIMTSNFPVESYDDKSIVVSFVKLVKCGWDAMDNSTIMLLRLLNDLGIRLVAIAGFDGYVCDLSNKNYFSEKLEIQSASIDAIHKNQEIKEMLIDFNLTKRDDMQIRFISPSRFQEIFEE